MSHCKGESDSNYKCVVKFNALWMHVEDLIHWFPIDGMSISCYARQSTRIKKKIGAVGSSAS